MPLSVPHIDVVKDALGDEVIQALSLVLENSSGMPPSTPSARFRADHPHLMDTLDRLGWDGLFLKRNDTATTYRVSGFALPLIASSHAVKLLECMNATYEHFKSYYAEHLREPLPLSELISFSGTSSDLAQEALCYMHDIDGWSAGSSSNFPIDPDSNVTINEQVLTHGSLGDLLARVYEWNYVNPRHKATSVTNWSHHLTPQLPSVIFTETSSLKFPQWYEKLAPNKKALLNEIDIALRNELAALPMMGLRALLESVMVERIGDSGGFEAKLKLFEKSGYITPQHADIIRKVLDAGHASMHRTYFPNADDLETCVDVVKHLLHGVYVLHPKVLDLAANIPLRQPIG